MKEMNEEKSFKSGVKFADTVYMGEDFLGILHLFICKRTGSKLQPI